ncbi:hypothetical protein QC761_300365 [Podospora bellae-mahoneyi]|uniref:Uncharacterized protein n=1 Tax=Podospora bellae-mahoneyi TaxID=2093777 RepID=A0ABR0FJ14_9PEZI|nr:hypothetical protein QC761_300365 [Podospora bellae-mahoneyi]
MGQKSSCLAHKHTGLGTASAEQHRQPENGTAQDLLKDIARKSKLQARGMSGKCQDGEAGTGSSMHVAEQNGNTVGESASTKRLRITSTEDTDTETTVTAPVVQEVVKPHVHEIRQEEIHRDIHVHTNHTIIQPVYDLEALPPRHFVPDETGKLVEVSESDLPACTGRNAQWHIAAGPVPDKTKSKQALGTAAITKTGSPNSSSGAVNDSDTSSSTDSVPVMEVGQQEEATPIVQKAAVPRSTTTQANEGTTKKSSRLPKPSTAGQTTTAAAK